MFKKLIYILFFILAHPSENYTIDVLDSLIQEVETMPDDSLKCETYIKIAYILYNGNDAVEYSYRAISLAKKLNSPRLIGRAFHRAAWCHDYDKMNLKTAYLDSAVLFFNSINDKNGLGKVYDTKGAILMNYESFEESEKAYQQGFDLYVETSNKERQAAILNNWAICDYMNGQPEKAIAKYNRALDFRLSEIPRAPIDIARIYVGLGQCSRLMGNYNLALENYIESYE